MARLSLLPVAVAASLGLAFGAFSTIARAGTQSNQDWFQDQPPQPPSSAPATAIGGAGGRDFGGPNGPAVQPPPPPRVIPQQANTANSGDFPGDQMQDWVNAYARMARTRALLRRAESNLDRSVRDAQLNFEQSREYRDAVAAEKKAYDEYTAERARALKSVLDDPKYVAALQLRDKMGEQLAHLRSEVRRSKSGPIPNDILLAMASQKLQFATDAHNLEAAALEKDDHLKDVRKQL
ncbi:MAG TPA: hypothetical protein VN541_12250, partial [Tepidisphaeraceae bacterium]|nr:hypothetical protein [Tepidisphaeraceae bacterium]